jgi:pyridoxal phosphate enzyme (YggS family)
VGFFSRYYSLLVRYTEAVTDIVANLNRVKEEIATTAIRCGRDPSTIKLLAVSKTFPASAVSEALAGGQCLFGENRVQEAAQKIPGIDSRDIEWHLIGHLQSNKVLLAVEVFDVIETVDSEKLARRISRHCVQSEKSMPVFVQVNIGGEMQKSGISPDQVEEMVGLVDSLPQLELRGLMTIPPLEQEIENTRLYFRKMARLKDKVNLYRRDPTLELSMGMSGDFRIAIEEGSTLVRVGTAVFGPRG